MRRLLAASLALALLAAPLPGCSTEPAPPPPPDVAVRRAAWEAWKAGRDELMGRLTSLPDSFPNSRRYAAELTSGTTADRFAFTLNLMLDGLSRP